MTTTPSSLPPDLMPDPDQESLPAAPKSKLSSPWSIRALFVWNDVKGRSAFAFRACLCTAIPILIGWLAGHEDYGLIATVGAFTALYGEQLPYHRRAVLLAGTGVGFVLAFAIGQLGTVTPFWGVITVAFFAGLLVLFYNSLNLGRPGAYLLILACAMGTMVKLPNASLVEMLLTVAGGSLCAWLVQMSGYLIVPYGPQRRIVLASARAVHSLVRVLGKPSENTARNLAAAALQDSWEMLAGLPPDNPFQRLNRRCNLLFAAANRRDTPTDKLQSVSEALVRDAQHMSPRWHSRKKLKFDLLDDMNPHYVDEQTGINHRRNINMLLEGLFEPFSEPRRAAVRIFLGTLIAGILGLLLGLVQAFWAMAAAALVLQQCGGRKMLLQRGWFRLIGTLAGLLAAEGIIILHPQGFWLVIVMAVLRFLTEISVMRNYALSVVFITPTSLLVAAEFSQNPGALFLARGVDTLLGVVVATVILFTVFTRTGQRHVPAMLEQILDDCQDLLNQLTHGEIYTQETRRLQVRLRRHIVGLNTAYDVALNESSKIERLVNSYWPNVVRIQRLGYKVLSAGWNLREGYNLDFSRMQDEIMTERKRYRSLITSGYPVQESGNR